MAMFINPGVEAAQIRARLAMTSSATPAASSSAPAAGASPGSGAAGAGADQAAAGAEGVQPPSSSKTIIASVLRGAVSGASVMFGLNSFGPKVPFINNFMTKVITKIPLVSKLGWPMGTLGALGVGAAMGAVFGLVNGVRKARSEAAAFVAAQQQAMANKPAGPVGDPLVLGPDGKPIKVDPSTNRPAKVRRNPKMGPGYTGVRGADAHASSTRYHIRRGDTLWALSRRFGVSIQDIVRANPNKIHNPNLIYAGDTIIIPSPATARAARRRAARSS
jgi:nucleoid-associated protein YgaU